MSHPRPQERHAPLLLCPTPLLQAPPRPRPPLSLSPGSRPPPPQLQGLCPARQPRACQAQDLEVACPDPVQAEAGQARGAAAGQTCPRAEPQRPRGGGGGAWGRLGLVRGASARSSGSESSDRSTDLHQEVAWLTALPAHGAVLRRRLRRLRLHLPGRVAPPRTAGAPRHLPLFFALRRAEGGPLAAADPARVRSRPQHVRSPAQQLQEPVAPSSAHAPRATPLQALLLPAPHQHGPATAQGGRARHDVAAHPG